MKNKIIPFTQSHTITATGLTVKAIRTGDSIVSGNNTYTVVSDGTGYPIPDRRGLVAHTKAKL